MAIHVPSVVMCQIYDPCLLNIWGTGLYRTVCLIESVHLIQVQFKLNVVIGAPDKSSQAIYFSNVETHLAPKGFGRGISVVPG